jgi:broad specificity phosphatase PhoE
MAPTIHLVRHAQGFHNLSVENESLHDPDLTPLGEDQCRLLSEVFGDHERLTRLVASPLRRTLHTCLRGFGGRDGAPLPVIALDVLQEVSANQCDVGTAPDQLAAEFGDRVDLRRVDPGFVDKGPDSRFEPTLEKLTARAREGRLALRDLAGDLDGDDHIVAVSHGGFLHFLTDDYYGVPSGRGMVTRKR